MTATLTRPAIVRPTRKEQRPKGLYCHIANRPRDGSEHPGNYPWTERIPQSFYGPRYITLADGTQINCTWEEFSPKSKYLGSTFLSPGCALSYEALSGPCCRLYYEETKHGLSLTPHASEYAGWVKKPGRGYVKTGDSSLSYLARFFDCGFNSVPKFVTKFCKT